MIKKSSSQKYHKTFKTRGGSEILLRPITPKDTQGEFDMFSNFSDKSSYYRFFGIKKVSSPKDVEEFTNIDYTKNFAIVALSNPDTQIGVGRICEAREGAELAIILVDSWQRKGIGTEIMKLLLPAAKERGYKKLIGEVMSDNVGMLEFVKKLGFNIRKRIGSDYYKIEIKL